MFSRVAARLPKPSAVAAGGIPSRISGQLRFASKQASQGSRGRAMPSQPSRATAPVSNLDATLTIRVRLARLKTPSHPVYCGM